MNRTMIFAFALLWAFALKASTLQAGGERPGPSEKDSTAKLIQYLDDKEGYVRAAAADLLGARKAREAIPKLQALLSDGTALRGSDHYVAQHAEKALALITEDERKVQELIQEIKALRERLEKMERRLSELEKKQSK